MIQLIHSFAVFPGLAMELYIEQDEYIPSLTDGAGIKLLIHDRDKIPFPRKTGVLLTPHTITSISIRKVRRQQYCDTYCQVSLYERTHLY